MSHYEKPFDEAALRSAERALEAALGSTNASLRPTHQGRPVSTLGVRGALLPPPTDEHDHEKDRGCHPGKRNQEPDHFN